MSFINLDIESSIGNNKMNILPNINDIIIKISNKSKSELVTGLKIILKEAITFFAEQTYIDDYNKIHEYCIKCNHEGYIFIKTISYYITIIITKDKNQANINQYYICRDLCEQYCSAKYCKKICEIYTYSLCINEYQIIDRSKILKNASYALLDDSVSMKHDFTANTLLLNKTNNISMLNQYIDFTNSILGNIINISIEFDKVIIDNNSNSYY